MSTDPLRLVIVEQSPEGRAALRLALEAVAAERFRFIDAASNAEALAACRSRHVDCVLLDHTLPHVDAADFMSELSSGRDQAGRAVVVLSDRDDEPRALEAMRRGARDHLVRDGVTGEALHRAITNAVERSRLERELLDTRDLLGRLAQQDPLTGLPNRRAFRTRLDQALARARRRHGSLALLFIDLDDFKKVNDALGHCVGDLVLKEVAARFGRCLRREDVLARLGGDEFTILLEDLGDPRGAIMAGHRLLEALAEPIRLDADAILAASAEAEGAAAADEARQLGEQEIAVTASIGVALHPQDARTADGLLQRADAAMYSAKALGRNACHLYTADMTSALSARLALADSLRGALDRGEFELHYQPLVDADSGDVIGAEALARWRPTDRVSVSPSEFIPVLEQTGMMVPVGEWILRSACEQLRSWHDVGLTGHRVSVNISPRQLVQQGLARTVWRILEEMELQPAFLELELTEAAFADENRELRATLDMLRAMGVRLSLDDFGSGSCSLSNLRRFPLDTLKLDRSFTVDVANERRQSAFASALVSMGRTLGLSVVAEGVETAEQLSVLRGWGCDTAQGYLFCRPLPADDLTPLLRGAPGLVNHVAVAG